ncbi:MAG: aminoglycoside phosphotransferase family protein [Lachnospiraceae bacterium]|nr:aminoglycoside phosphotransferase family protein [Lachnospiraceae bacterium]
MSNPKEPAAVLNEFDLEGPVISARPYGSGHINDTFLVTVQTDDGGRAENASRSREKRYILQRMNDDIFHDPKALMENVVHVTSFLQQKIKEQGGDPERETLNIIRTKDGRSFVQDSEGNPWRMYRFIENATSFDQVEKPDDFYQSALAFGRFQRMLADYPAGTLHETIPDFHNTPVRLAAFKKAVEEDVCRRAAGVEKEIRFILDREADTHVLTDLQAQGRLPLRVTHNDTKLNNVMIDNATGQGLCVIDLDTVMPGLALNDYGDSIRFGASTAAEDETDLSKVSCDLELFELYTRGFIEGCGGSLTEMELAMLPMGAKLMTLECGMRFLADYLQGDIYFKTHRKGHNLDRCRTQLKLVWDMEKKWEQMQAVVALYGGNTGK